MSDVWQAGELDSIAGIGKDIVKKIDELRRTGMLSLFERPRAKVLGGVAALLDVPDLWPKRVEYIWETVGRTDLDALEAALREGCLRDLLKMGAKTEQRILSATALMSQMLPSIATRP